MYFDLEQLHKQVADVFYEVAAFRRDIHMHPELSEHEARTETKICDWLNALDIPYEKGIAGPVSYTHLVTECNDGELNDIRGMHLTEADVRKALETAGEKFEEWAVGGGTGMICMGMKGGIGSASRIVEMCIRDRFQPIIPADLQQKLVDEQIQVRLVLADRRHVDWENI